MNTQKGFLPIIALIIIVLIIGFVGGYFLNNKNIPTEQINTNSNGTTSAQDINTTEQLPTSQTANTAPTGYKTYTNSTIGFSTSISNKGMVGDAKTDISSRISYENERPQFVYVYGPDPKTDIRTWIIVWQEERGVCLPDSVINEPNFIEPRQNKANLTVLQRNWNGAAMGQYEDLSIYTISNGKKQYCVIGQIHGARPYNLEGQAYEDREKINTAATVEFRNVLKVFVDDFKFI